ncbi:MAG TPA: MoaD/ThiS family protein [Chloroflexota bacterium]|jgi:molybdopterin converting factor small subunit|nr:MoaD/ThiS family protein [Chloroflexota bacterium]
MPGDAPDVPATPGPSHGAEIELPDGLTAGNLIDLLRIAPDLECVVGVNGVLATRETVLADGDEVLLVPPLRGGA